METQSRQEYTRALNLRFTFGTTTYSWNTL